MTALIFSVPPAWFLTVDSYTTIKSIIWLSLESGNRFSFSTWLLLPWFTVVVLFRSQLGQPFALLECKALKCPFGENSISFFATIFTSSEHKSLTKPRKPAVIINQVNCLGNISLSLAKLPAKSIVRKNDPLIGKFFNQLTYWLNSRHALYLWL